MKMQAKKQYTIRGVSSSLDRSLRQKAISEGKSLNSLLVATLANAAGVAGESVTFHDLDDLAGKWQEDPEFDRALELQDKIEEDLWK